MSITKDIRIGNTQWIRWVDFNPTGNLLDIDEWLKPTIEFWDRLETQCIAECCGMAAFSFWPADIKLASESLDRTELINQITHLKSLIIQQPENVLISERLNNYLDRFVFIELLDHINTCLNSLE